MEYVFFFSKCDPVFKLYDVIVDLLDFLVSSLHPLVAITIDIRELQKTPLNREDADQQIISRNFFSNLYTFRVIWGQSRDLEKR